MRFATAVICLSAVAHGFSVTAPTFTKVALRAAGADDYDDWYADFDPSKFDAVVQSSSSTSATRRDRGDRGRGDDVGGSSSHDYQRDLSADNSNVNLDAVNSLIAERLQARKSGRFDEADAIRDVLLDQHGVSVWDKDKKWRSGVSRSGSGASWGRSQPRGRPERGGPRGGPRKPKNFGPNGHDYYLAADAGPITSSLSESDIHARIAERLQCKMNRNFKDADAIQMELESMGVYVNDGRKEWRADGERFGDFQPANGRGPGRTAGSRLDRFRPYEQSPSSLPTNDIDQIRSLIEERVEAKKARAFDVADDIQGELRQNFNVEINDKTREWSVGGDFGMGRREDLAPYEMSRSSQPPDDVPRVQALVDSRETARKRRNFEEADDIRDELRQIFNVEVDDKIRQWAVGGSFDVRPRREGPNGPPPPFSRRGGGNLSNEDIAIITKLIEERDEAKKGKEFGKADRIRDRLSDEFAVRVDDRSREWMVVTDEYAMFPVSAIDEDTKAFIEKRIGERAIAKLAKDYDVADAIRDELLNDYQVFLDDRVKEWFIEGATPLNAASAAPVQYAEDDDAADPMFADLDSVIDEVFSSDDVEEDDDDANSVAMSNDPIAQELAALKVDELKERLREAGLPVSGKKSELIERLLEA